MTEMALAPDGKTLFGPSLNRVKGGDFIPVIRVYDLVNHKEKPPIMCNFEIKPVILEKIAISPEGRFLAVAGTHEGNNHLFVVAIPKVKE